MTTNSLTYQAYRLLYGQIISGGVAAGDVLSETRLAEEFGISRMQLAAIGQKLSRAKLTRPKCESSSRCGRL